MTARLVYVIGPSGSGKDSVLGELRGRWPAQPLAHWAKRTITRPVSPHGERHEPVDDATFAHLMQKKAFALHWVANGLSYGVRHDEVSPLSKGHWVFVNGSRAHLPELLALRPEATIVHIGASAHVLQERLLTRGRETPQAIAARLAREIPLQLPVGSICIQNDGPLSDAVSDLLQKLLSRHVPATASP